LKKVVFGACCLFMFVSLMLTGCEEFLEPLNYITVTVSVRARAIYQYTDSNGVTVTSPNTGAQVQLRIQKAQGEQSIWEVTTDSNGYTPTKTASFDVYKEQPVEASARPLGFGVTRYDFRIFHWTEIWLLAGEEFGESISVNALDLVLVTIPEVVEPAST
jgi:hypothetical protein